MERRLSSSSEAEIQAWGVFQSVGQQNGGQQNGLSLKQPTHEETGSYQQREGRKLNA
jgi:hypothetical protein